MEIVNGAPYLKEVRHMITEYTNRLGRDLSFQNLDTELADVADKYLPPHGNLLVAKDGEQVVGMVAYHQLSPTRSEMKRLYVSPTARHLHAGDALVSAIIVQAKQDGYQEMVLDTLPHLQAAVHLYQKHGFRPCEPYYHNPMEDVMYFRRSLVD